jgi:hypothetical protein
MWGQACYVVAQSHIAGTSLEYCSMADGRKSQSPEGIWLVQRLVKVTGVTEAKADELIGLLGADWSSLVREARLLARSPRGSTPAQLRQKCFLATEAAVKYMDEESCSPHGQPCR